MRNLLALVGLLVIVGGGTGWYMGWYKFSFSRATDGNIEIKTHVDAKKVETDSSTFFKNAATVVGNHIDKSVQNANASTPNGTPGATPGPVDPAQEPTFPTPPLPPAPRAPRSSRPRPAFRLRSPCRRHRFCPPSPPPDGSTCCRRSKRISFVVTRFSGSGGQLAQVRTAEIGSRSS